MGKNIGGSEDSWYWAVTHQEWTVRPWQGEWWSMSGGTNQWWHVWWWQWQGWSNTGSWEGWRP